MESMLCLLFQDMRLLYLTAQAISTQHSEGVANKVDGDSAHDTVHIKINIFDIAYFYNFS